MRNNSISSKVSKGEEGEGAQDVRIEVPLQYLEETCWRRYHPQRSQHQSKFFFKECSPWIRLTMEQGESVRKQEQQKQTATNEAQPPFVKEEIRGR